jgi:hypothetical protein
MLLLSHEAGQSVTSLLKAGPFGRFHDVLSRIADQVIICAARAACPAASVLKSVKTR